jgi:glycosyltransferase involved in cell wall biosynthesis
VSARIAVVVPCHDDGALIGETLASLREPEPLEIVVVDDGSTDPATLAVLDELRAEGTRVERHERNRGLSAARMTGLRATSAPFVFPLDSDDLAVPGALTAMADRLEHEPAAVVCFGDYEEFGDQRRLVRVPPRLDPYRIAYRNEYPVSSLFRREALLAAGGWRDIDGEIGYEDWNLWMALAERGAQGVHLGPGVPIYRRRLHGTRMLGGAATRHRVLYRKLRELHPALFGGLAAHRRRTDLGPARRLLYPLAYGARPPLGLVTRLRRLRDRAARQAGP